MTGIHIVDHPEQVTAGMRAQVPVGELAGYFPHAFHDTMAALQDQGEHPVGAPFGKYYGEPGAVVDVEAGFPVAVVIAPVGNVLPGRLPAGRCLEATHIGPLDTIGRTYAEIQRFFADNKLKPSEVMWESYLTDSEMEPDPRKWRTLICWPIA